MNENKIDFVIAYVNPNDPDWLKIAEEKGVFDDTASGKKEIRYQDDGTIELAVDSIRKFCPWAGDIYLLLFDSLGQLPESLKDKVKVIWHSEFIPEQYRPCFNSSCIEIFMPFLPRVSETFIYMNDDMIITRPLSKSLFIRNGLPRHDCRVIPAVNNDQNMIAINTYNILLGVKQRAKRLKYKHGPIAYNKSQMLECWERYKDKISVSPLRRKDADTSRILYTFYNFLYYNIGESPINVKSLLNTKSYIEFDWNNINKYDSICMNSTPTGNNIKMYVNKVKEYIENERVTINNSSDV